MSTKCRECGEGRLRITGLGGYDDLIAVECDQCGAEYEVEPDGLGQGGLEFVDAQMIEQRKREQDDAEDEDESDPDEPDPEPES